MNANQVKYQQVFHDLRARIANGEFGEAGQLPAKTDLQKAYGVSDITIRRALNELLATGLLQFRIGRGNGYSVNRLQWQKLGGKGAYRLSLYLQLPFDGSWNSDLPSLIGPMTEYATSFDCGLEILPFQQSQTMSELIQPWRSHERPRGIIVMAGDCRLLHDLVTELKDYQLPFVLVWTYQEDREIEYNQNCSCLRLDEDVAAAQLIDCALARGIHRIQYVGMNSQAVMRACGIIRANAHGRLLCSGENLGIRPDTLTEFLLQHLRFAARHRDLLLIVDGTARMLDSIMMLMLMEKLHPGTDVSIAYFQHYSDLRKDQQEIFSGIMRPYEQIARKSIDMLLDEIAAPNIHHVQILNAEFRNHGSF